jgi:hypothetical protein
MYTQQYKLFLSSALWMKNKNKTITVLWWVYIKALIAFQRYPFGWVIINKNNKKILVTHLVLYECEWILSLLYSTCILAAIELLKLLNEPCIIHFLLNN